MPWWWFQAGRVRASEVDRIAALHGPPLEKRQTHKDAATLVAGQAETTGALPVKTPHFEGAIYSSRGKGYARYNEDAAALFTDRTGRIYGAVFDQAGGLGGNVRGDASELAAISAYEAFRRIATEPELDVAQTLIDDGVLAAHHALVNRRQGEVTTAVIAAVLPNQAFLVNSGDSAGYLFRNGTAVRQTVAHEADTPFGFGALTHAVGMIPGGPNPETYTWALEPGDHLLLCSDGLLDSGLPPAYWGRLMQESESPEIAVNELVKRVLRRMTTLRAKPDNLTVVLIKRTV